MNLEDLIGRHFLSGVDFEVEKARDGGDASVINFVLDGITYTAIEDVEDGYRSCLSEIYESKKTVKNSFQAVEVIGSMSDSGKDNIIEFKAVRNGKIVLEVGTSNTDDYYPSFVAHFGSENIPPYIPKRKGRMLRLKT